MHACMLSQAQLFATPWTVAHQVPLFMEFSRQEYWSGLLFIPPGDLSNPGIEPTSVSSAWTSRFLTTEPPGKPKATTIQIFKNPEEEAVI